MKWGILADELCDCSEAAAKGYQSYAQDSYLKDSPFPSSESQKGFSRFSSLCSYLHYVVIRESGICKWAGLERC